MNNLSVLVIPVTKKPASPPPLGQVYVYFTPENELMTLDSDNSENRLHLKKHTEQISLTESFNILNVKSPFIMEVEGNQTGKLLPGKLVVIDGSTGGTNDKLLTVQSSTVDGENTNVAFEEGGLATDLDEDGEVHIDKTVTINHKLGTKSIAFSIRDFISGNGEVRVDNNTPDNDNLILTPNVPVPGTFLVTVVG